VGQDVRWHRGEHHHDGRAGCRVTAAYADQWNRTAWRRVRSCIARRMPKLSGATKRARWIWPLATRRCKRAECSTSTVPGERRHARGARRLHDVSGRARRTRARVWLRRDRQGQPVGQVGPRRPTLRSRRGYLSKDARSGSIAELVVAGKLPSRAIYVSTQLVRRTGISIRALRVAGYYLASSQVDTWLEAVARAGTEAREPATLARLRRVFPYR
jgi:hypothetical protein